MRAGADGRAAPAADVDLLIPVFIVPGDTPEEREHLARRARTQIGFYGSTKNYAFQFDDLGFEGTSAKLNERLKAGDMDGLAATITDEMLDTFAIVGRWDDIADRIIGRYAGRRRAGDLVPHASTTSRGSPTTSPVGARSPEPCATPIRDADR